MSFDIRLPQINAKTEAEKQIASYLFQLATQLQLGLQSIETSTKTNVIVSPTPRSLQSGTQAAQSPEATFGSIKALIIKSADIVNAYYEEINKRLVGEYVAESDFGIFREQTIQDIESNSTEIEQFYSNIQEIVSDIENISYTLQAVNAHIRSGKLYEDENGLPVYGLEIGQKNIIDGEEVFNKFARFTSDRLSFYDHNGSEVAYVSDYKLYIRAVEITSSFKIGGYVDMVMANGDVITKWVGRS